jgi:hypothetical protein
MVQQINGSRGFGAQSAVGCLIGGQSRDIRDAAVPDMAFNTAAHVALAAQGGYDSIFDNGMYGHGILAIKSAFSFYFTSRLYMR